MAGFFPMFVRLAGRIVVVVGGNETAARTVDALIACDAEVRVISPTFCPQLRRLRGTPNLTLIARSLEHGDLEDALLAIAVDDDPTVNLRAAREGLEWNVLVTVADELALSDFVVPSFVHRGKLTLALHAVALGALAFVDDLPFAPRSNRRRRRGQRRRRASRRTRAACEGLASGGDSKDQHAGRHASPK